MKKILCIGLASVAILFGDVCFLNAKSQRESDYVYLGVSGGYSVLSGKVSPMEVFGSGNVGGHVGYEYRCGLFLLRASGNIQMLNSRCSTPISIPDMIFEDQQGTDATMHYDMQSPLKEKQRCSMLGVGAMVGYSQNSCEENRKNGGFYFLGGLNFLYRISFYSDVSLNYSTTATYSAYIDDYVDMPNHYYSEQHSENKVDFINNGGWWQNISIMLSAEIGWEWNFGWKYRNKKSCQKLKLGAFCDLGMTNVMKDLETIECYPNMDNISKITVDSYYKSYAMKDKYVIPIMVGVRLGLSINVSNLTCSTCAQCYRR